MANAAAAAVGVISWAGLSKCCCTSGRQEGANTAFLGRTPHSANLCPGWVPRSSRGARIRAANMPPEGWGRVGKLKSQQGQKKGPAQKEKSLEGWTEVAQSLEVEEGKNKATIHGGKGYVVVKSRDELFGIDANCASCKFPLIEGKVTMTADNKGPQIECPLCHSKFLLADGTVLEYCPKDGPLQWVVGTLKEKAPRENTKVYPARVSRSGRIYFQFVKQSTEP